VVAQIDLNYIKTRPTKMISRLISYVLFEGRPLTTRGRWINPLVFASFAAAKRLPQLRVVRQPVFILGTGRSGTTVLGMVLSMHREVGFLNEAKAIWHAVHPGEDLIGSYSKAEAQCRLDAEDATPQRIEHAHRLFGAYLAAVGAARVVDKYPELIYRIPFVKELFPDARFLFLVRNGWDTCRSIENWSVKRGQKAGEETHDWWGVNNRKWKILVEQLIPEHRHLAPYAETMLSWRNDTDRAAVEWILAMREGLSLLKQNPADVLRVDYEELCMKPRQTLQTMGAFLGLAPGDEAFLRYGETTLKPTPAHGPFRLNKLIEGVFQETMQALGYRE
jgi:hypothetical protein